MTNVSGMTIDYEIFYGDTREIIEKEYGLYELVTLSKLRLFIYATCFI